jgi:hypothetical protein
MSEIHDAIALHVARTHYTVRARELEEAAIEEAKQGRALESRKLRYQAKIARRAAFAELVNPEVPNA